ncbi:MAG: tRNA lysidine(34) synthetase TilS [Melioribacteraceae bacterium]|nr:tRNA lysidine(34) synthetase TilS [Melioribacteraceae bacterium]
MNRKIEQNIIHFISKQKLFENGDKLLIALSGGPDSVFALQFFHKFKSKFEIEITAMHVNHQLRGDESDGDEVFCKLLCEEVGVSFVSVKVDVKTFADKNKQSIEEAARNLRYQKLSGHASKIKAAKIVTAHNLEDNTETVLLNLFRGTGLKGASGIPIKRDNIIRPFLSVSKVDILSYLNSNKIKYRIDSTNFENDFTRNYLRNEIIPKVKENINSGIDNNILRFSEIASQSEKAIHDYADEIRKKFITKSESGIEISNLIATEKFENIFPNSIKLGLEKEFKKVFTFDDISKIKSIFSLQVGSKAELSNNVVAIKEREFVLVTAKSVSSISDSYELKLNQEVQIGNKIISAKIVELESVKFSSSKNIEFINGDNISFPLTIRKWENGDKFQPIGLKGSKKISDFLTEAKVNSRNKKEQLVLLNGNKIIWVVGNRIDESVKINNETKRIIKLFVRCI